MLWEYLIIQIPNVLAQPLNMPPNSTVLGKEKIKRKYVHSRVLSVTFYQNMSFQFPLTSKSKDVIPFHLASFDPHDFAPDSTW